MKKIFKILPPFATCGLLAVFLGVPSPGWAQISLLYSNNFDSYTAGSYPSPSNPLSGWNAMSSQSGLIPSITSAVNASGQALNLDGNGGGATSWMSVNSPLLAGSTSNWSVSGSARYIASNHTSWYGSGGLLLSSTGDMTGDFLLVGIESGWGEVNATTTWARPYAYWSLGGVTSSGTLWTPVVDNGGAIRMSTDTWGPALLTASRTGGSSNISFTINSPVDADRIATLSFSGAQATALDNLQYVGFANYFSEWQYDSLAVSGVPEPSSAALLGLAGFGLLLHRRRRQA